MERKFKSKVCTKCDRRLKRSGFHKSSRNRDGLQVWCKDCQYDSAVRLRRRRARAA